jgi:hypothetical protein
MITTTIGNNERQALDGEASCASTQHILIALRDGDDDNGNEDNKVKRTCYASNVDATTSPGNVKLRRARATPSNIDDLVRKCTRLSSAISHCVHAHMAFSHRAQAHKLHSALCIVV